MAGRFDPDLRPDAWFDPELIPDAWFDRELVTAVAVGPTDHALPLADSVALTDARVHAFGKAVSDPLTLADSATPVISKAVQVTDSLSLADARGFAQGKATADSVALADSLSRVAATARALTDSLSLADARGIGQSKALADAIGGAAAAGVDATHLTAGGSATDANSYTTASITPTADALVLAAVAVGKTGTPDTPTLTGNGLTWVLEDSATYDASGTFGKLFLFRALGASPTSGTVAIAFGGVTQLGCVWSIDEFTGVDTSGTNGSGAIVQSVPEVETDLGNTAATTLAAFGSADNATYAAVAKQTAEGFTPGGGFNELGDTFVSTPVISVLTEWKDTNDTSVDATWATAGEKSGIIAVEIKAAAAVAGLVDSISPVITVGGTDHEVPVDDTLALADAQAYARGLELGTGRFGQQSLGANTFTLTANRIQLSQFTVTAEFVALRVWFYVDSVTDSQETRGVIYSDTGGGAPSVAYATTLENVPDEPGWFFYTFEYPIFMPVGTWWIGIHAGVVDGALTGLHDGSASTRPYKTDTYADGSINTFGTPTGTANGRMSLYVEGVETGTRVWEDEDGGFTRTIDYGRTQSDGLILSDQALDAQGIRLGDIVALADVLARAVTAARTLTDSLLLADSLSRVLTLARTLTDTVLLADARTFSRGKVLADSVALTDQLSRVSVSLRGIADSVTVSDNLDASEAGVGEVNPSDFIVLADVFSRVATYTRSVADSVLLADARSIGIVKTVADYVALADQLARTVAIVRALADSVSLTDDVDTDITVGTIDYTRQVDDLLALADVLFKGYGKVVADAVSLTDSLTSVSGRGVSIADVVTVTDFFSRLATYTRTPADSVLVSDLFLSGALKPLPLADIVLLSDAQDIFAGIITVLMDPIYTGHIGMGWTGGISDLSHGDAQDGIGEERNGHIGNGHNGGLALVTSGGPEEDDQE